VPPSQLSIQVHTLELLLYHLDKFHLLCLNLLPLPCFRSIPVGPVIVVVSQVHLFHLLDLLIHCNIGDFVRVLLQDFKNPACEVGGMVTIIIRLGLEIVIVRMFEK
jgi:hypothetical protein